MRRRARVFVILVGAAIAVSPLVLHRAGARGDTTPGSGLGGYRLSSRAAGLEVIYNDGSQVALTLPFAETDAGSGTGHALAADAYPGPVGGNPGATLKQFLGGNLPPAVADALGTLTDPAKAEAYNTGPTDSSFPENGPIQGLSDTAHVDANGGSMSAIGAYTQVGGIDSRASSVTTIGTSSVTTVATSTVSDVGIGDLVHIGKVSSTATATSDGTSGRASGVTTIAGLTVAGMSVSFDAKGLTLGPTKVPIAVGSMVNTVLAPLGVHLTVSPEVHMLKGAKIVEHASALLISIAPPNNGGNTFQVILGGAEAEAQATPGFSTSSGSGPTPAVGSSSGVNTPSDSGAVSSGSGSTPGVVPSAGVSSDLGTTGTSAPTGTAAAPTAINPVPVSTTKGIGAGLVVFGLLVGAAGAFGLGKIPDDVLAEKPVSSVCPIERREP